MSEAYKPESKYDGVTEDAADAVDKQQPVVVVDELKLAQADTQANRDALQLSKAELQVRQIKFFKASARFLAKKAGIPEEKFTTDFFDKLDYAQPLTVDGQPKLSTLEKSSMQTWLDEFQKQLGTPFEKAMKFDKFVADFSAKIKQLPLDNTGFPVIDAAFAKELEEWALTNYEPSYWERFTDSTKAAGRWLWKRTTFANIVKAFILGALIGGGVFLAILLRDSLCTLASKSSGCYVTTITKTSTSRTQVIYNNLVPTTCDFSHCCNLDATCTSSSVSDTCGGQACCNASIDAQAADHPNGAYAYHCGSAVDWLFNILNAAGADLGGIWDTIKTVLFWVIIGFSILAGVVVIIKVGHYFYLQYRKGKGVVGEGGSGDLGGSASASNIYINTGRRGGGSASRKLSRR